MTMQKYLKITVSDLDYLIAASHVLTIERGSADTEVDILFDLVAHTAVSYTHLTLPTKRIV